jgi:circadian clock protein KaiC
VSEAVEIKKLASGVPGLDVLLGGGIPELSFNLIAGGPGCGKTSLAHQIMFSLASAECQALYITILGEPPIKMLRYQQQFAFFDANKVTKSVRFLHLGAELVDGGLGAVLDRIVKEIIETRPKLVFVDSFRAAVTKSEQAGQLELQTFVQRLSLHLTGWEATTFLIGEYASASDDGNPLFTVADGILWLSQERSRNSMVRQAKVVKMRGQGQLPGLHTMKISQAGIRVYPRLLEPERMPSTSNVRRGMGIPALDEMLGGGLPAGYSMLIVGPSGSGKTVLASAFVRAGLRKQEPCVIAVFEQRPTAYLERTPHGGDLRAGIAAGQLSILDLRPLDQSVDETMEKIANAVAAIGAKRVVIDSLSGFELALAPAFREDFREAAYRMVADLIGFGVSVVMTAEVNDVYAELRLAPEGISFLTDCLVVQRYVEIDGVLQKILMVAKMRGFEHSHELRRYDIDASGIVMRECPLGYEGLLTGSARRRTTRPA